MSANNILIRNLSDADNEHLKALQTEFRVNTNSQATLNAIRGYMSLHNDNRQLRAKYNESKQLIKEYEYIISNIRASVVDFHPNDDKRYY